MSTYGYHSWPARTSKNRPTFSSFLFNHKHTNPAVKSGLILNCGLPDHYTCWPVMQVVPQIVTAQLVECSLSEKDDKWKWWPILLMSSCQKCNDEWVNFLSGQWHCFVVNLCPNWSSMNSPRRTKHDAFMVDRRYQYLCRQSYTNNKCRKWYNKQTIKLKTLHMSWSNNNDTIRL